MFKPSDSVKPFKMNKIFVFVLVVSVVFAVVSAVPLQGELKGELVREKRAISCRAASSRPNNPSSYNEACNAHCILHGNRGGVCASGNCVCVG